MRNTFIIALLAVLFVGQAHADALWYSLENGSKVEMANGTSINLTGRIALAGCGRTKVINKGEKRLVPIYSVAIDNLPNELEPHVTDANKLIHLFRGEGEAAVTPKPVLIIHKNGKVYSFEWVLQHKLEQDFGNEATVFNRMLQLQPKQNSTISWQNEEQLCPDKIDLNLVAKDVWRTYKPHSATLSTGEQRTETVTAATKEEIIGYVSIVANIIPHSEEKIDDAASEQTKLAEGAYVRSTRATLKPTQKFMGQPAPAERYRQTQKPILPAQPAEPSNQPTK